MYKIKTPVLFLILLAYSQHSFSRLGISFLVSMPQPQTHMLRIEMHVQGEIKDSLVYKLPVWTPGYYKIMDYPINLYDFEARNSRAKKLDWKKTSKNAWVIKCSGEKEVIIEYKIYAFDKSVADCYLDNEMAYICPTGAFMHIEGNLNIPSKITIVPYDGWGSVSTGLERLTEQGFVYQANNFDQLYDCPILLGNHNEYKFYVDDIPYTIACNKKQIFNPDTLSEDLKKIIKTSTDMFGNIPYKHYTFIIMDNGRGGLEHQNSMAVFSNIPPKSEIKDYTDWLSFISHEFFHLYNVKAIRPINLGPFDYDKENYTHMLWVSEGFTVYYEYRILLEAGFIHESEFLENMSQTIRNYENTPGRLHQSAEESSFDAWIDFFQFKANRKNTSISYYDKGCALGMLLDLKIRHETKNEKSLDDVMQQLYNDFYLKKNRGFTDNEFRNICETIAGAKLDDIFDKYATTTLPVDYQKYLQYAGLTIDTSIKVLPGAFLGLDLSKENDKLIVSHIISGSPAENAGLSIKDEIIRLNDTPASLEFYENTFNTGQPGDELAISWIRNGEEHYVEVELIAKTTKTFAIKEVSEPNNLQVQTLKNWLLK